MASEKLVEIVGEIKENLNQTSSSAKDEVRVMKGMLNDPTYKVGVYSKKDGKIGEYCPYENGRDIVRHVLVGAARVPKAEAEEVSRNYEFGKAESTAFVNISKEFINTYVQTGRKLPLGGRETMNVSIQLKHVEETEKGYPLNGVGDDSKERGKVTIPEHDTLKVSGPCPSYLRK